MKISFIIPPTSFDLRWVGDNTTYPPLGVCIVAGIARKHHEVKIIDANLLHLTKEDILREIQTQSPDVIGIPCSATIMRKIVYELCSELKQNYKKDVIILLGGSDASDNAEVIMKECPLVDIITYGEGEYSTLNVLNSLEKKLPLESVDGIVFRSQNGVLKNKPCSAIKNLDELSFPAFDLLPDITKYRMSFKYKRLPSINIMTSRGCPHTCVFCAVKQTGYRYNSPEYVYNYMKHLREQLGIMEVTIFDDNFTLLNDRVEKICDLIIENKLDITWSCLGTIASLQNNPKLIQKMAAAGCWYIFFGLESGNIEVLKKNKISKIPNLEVVQKVVGWCVDSGINVKGSFIIGLPGDTKQTIYETLEFAKSLPLTAVNFSFPVPHPGTEFYDVAMSSGTFNYEDYNNMSSHSQRPVYAPEGISIDWLEKMQKKAYREYYFRPSFIIRQIKGINSLEDVKRYTKMAYLYAKRVLTPMSFKSASEKS